MQLFSNNSKGEIDTAGITAVATSLPLKTGHGARFPALAGGDYFLATLYDGTNIEIVCVTARSGDTLTIQRAYEGIQGAGSGTAYAFAADTKVEMRLTDGSFTRRTEIALKLVTVDQPLRAGYAQLFSRSWAGRGLPSWDGATGNPTRLQTNLYGNQIILVKPNTGSTATHIIGAAKTEGGTLTHPTLAATNFFTKQRRAEWRNVATTANQFLGARITDVQCFRGAAAGEGGFFFFCRFAFPLFPAATRVFVGLASLTTGVHVTANPSAAAAHHIGLAMDSADTNLTLFTKDGTTNTKLAIGAGLPRTASEVYDLTIFAKQNAANIGVRLDRVTSGGVASNLLDTTISTTIPSAATFLAPLAAMSNVAITGVGTVGIAVMSLYLETDF